MPSSTRCASLVAVFLLLASPVAGQVEDGKGAVKQVFAAWKQRQQSISRIRYVASGEMIVPKGSITTEPSGASLATPIPSRDISCPKKMMMLLDFEAQKHRFEKEENYYDSTTGAIRPRVTTTAFDGKEYRSALPRGVNNSPPDAFDVCVQTGNLREAGFVAEDWAPFVAHGFVPRLASFILPGRYQPVYDTGDFYLHGTAMHAGRKCLVVRTEAEQHSNVIFDEYWVDMAREGAVLRQVSYAGGRAAIDLDVQYQKTEQGWLLAGWTLVRRGKTGQTLRIERMRVDRVEPSVSVVDADFQIPTSPGMKVLKVHKGGNPDSIAQPATVTEEKYVVDARNRLHKTGESPHPSSRSAIWWIAGAAALVVGAGLFWWKKGRRKLVRPA